MDTLISIMNDILGLYVPAAGTPDYQWLAAALLLCICVWGIFRVLLACLHIIGGGKS